MGKAPEIPDYIREELEGVFTIVPFEDGTVGLYYGRVKQPSGYPEFEVRENEICRMDHHGYERMYPSAGGLIENLTLIAFTEGKAAKSWRERRDAFYRERNSIKSHDSEGIDAVYRKYFREYGLEAMITPDGVPREGLLAYCRRDGHDVAIYTRDNVELCLGKREAFNARDASEWRLHSSVHLLPRISAMNSLEARYGLHLPLEQWERIYWAMPS